MGNCGNCKHWTKPDEHYGPSNPFHSRYDGIDETSTIHTHRICSLITLADRADREAPPKAYTMDASDYMATLWVAPDFGCALFEAKEGT